MQATPNVAASPGSPLICNLSNRLSTGAAHVKDHSRNGDDLYRRYAATLTSRAQICGSPDVWSRKTLWHVGPRAGLVANFARSRTAARFASKHVVSDVTAAKLSAAVTKEATFTTRFGCMDFGGMVERLAAGLAYFSFTGTLTGGMLSANTPLNVGSIKVSDVPVSTGEREVFIPRSVDKPMRANVFYALVKAANGTGAYVRTDMLNVDGNGAPLVPAFSDNDLAAGVLDALHSLGCNMNESGAGALFALAVTRGIHKMATVPGHTDEGSWIRKVFRTGEAAACFGAILPTDDAFVGLPVAGTMSQAVAASIVDSIALSTSAIVALADPTVTISGVKYPTFATDPSVRVGASTDPNVAGDPVQVAQSIGETFADFAAIYIKILCELFSVTTVHPDAALLLTGYFHAASWTGDGHLSYAVVSPYFWVEPTGILPKIGATYAASEIDSGCLCWPDSDTEGPVYPAGSTGEVKGIGQFSSNKIIYHSFRRVRGFIHLAGHPHNGLGSTAVVQTDPTAFVCVGGNGDVGTRMTRNLPWSGLLWVTGDSMIPKPSEAVQKMVGLTGFNARLSKDDPSDFMRVVDTHFYRGTDLNAPVSFSTTAPELIDRCRLDKVDKQVNRARTAGAFALQSAAGLSGHRASADLLPLTFGPATSGFAEASNMPAHTTMGGGHIPGETVVAAQQGEATFDESGAPQIVMQQMAARPRPTIAAKAQLSPRRGGGGGAVKAVSERQTSKPGPSGASSDAGAAGVPAGSAGVEAGMAPSTAPPVPRIDLTGIAGVPDLTEAETVRQLSYDAAVAAGTPGEDAEVVAAAAVAAHAIVAGPATTADVEVGVPERITTGPYAEPAPDEPAPVADFSHGAEGQ